VKQAAYTLWRGFPPGGDSTPLINPTNRPSVRESLRSEGQKSFP